MAERRDWATATTEVKHTAVPMGSQRENGPHLKDFRDFVEACAGLPDELLVFVDKGHMGESGRYDVTIRTTHRVIVPEAEAGS